MLRRTASTWRRANSWALPRIVAGISDGGSHKEGDRKSKLRMSSAKEAGRAGRSSTPFMTAPAAGPPPAHFRRLVPPPADPHEPRRQLDDPCHRPRKPLNGERKVGQRIR